MAKTSAERSRAYRLRKKPQLSPTERAWLDSYALSVVSARERATSKRKRIKGRALRTANAVRESVIFYAGWTDVDAIREGRWIERPYSALSRWEADAYDDDALQPDMRKLEGFRLPTLRRGTRLNIRAQIVIDGPSNVSQESLKPVPTGLRKEWVTLMYLTGNHRLVEADVPIRMRRFLSKEYVIGVIAIDVYVKQPKPVRQIRRKR